MANNLSAAAKTAEDGKPPDGMLGVADLVRMFEESEDATQEARRESERDRDYVDNKQLTKEELEALKKRGQPPQIDNRIKTKIDYLVGLEKQQRVKPKALPRTPVHEDDADSATEALRYVAEDQDYETKRSAVWRNMLVEGAGGISVYAEPSKYGNKPMNYGAMAGSTAMTPPQEMDICVRRIAWDRMFWDPHSSETDFSDANYLGVVVWMDYDDALVQYPDGKEVLEATLTSAPRDTYDDKPKFTHWADRKRRRVRICQIWIKRDDQWYFAEYTKGGILKAGASPYVTDRGESDCELIFQSAYVGRDNDRYGLVREMITLQDGINKRKSKSLHLLNSNQTTYEDGAIDDVELFRREKARPDGTMKVAPGALQNNRIQTETRADLAQAHVLLLQEDKNAIDLKGPNATQMGDKAGAGGSQSASGRAIIASQQGGMISLGDLMDNLRHMDKRVFRAVWNRIRQYWTAEKWIRVTDDEQNIKWVGMNVDPMRAQMLQQQMAMNPQAAQKIGGMIASVAELDCDIIIDEAPDVISQQEQFNALVQLKQFDANNEIPMRALIAVSNIKGKSKFIEEMDKAKQPPPGADVAQQLQIRGAAAEVADKEAAAGLKQAQTQKTLIEAHLAPAEAQHDAMLAEQDQAHRQDMERAGFVQNANEQFASRQERFAMKGADIQDRGADRQFQARESAANRQMKSQQPQRAA